MRGRRIEISYAPTEKQAAFHRSTANETLYGGAAGGGKSKALIMDALARGLSHPGTRAYLFRRTYRELEDTLIAEARASIPRELGVYNASRHEISLVGGSVLHFRHCRGTADMYDYAGTEMHWLYIDELTSFESQVYDYLKTRLRAKKALGIVPVVRCATNPGGIGHAWVKARFVDAGPPMAIVRHTVKSAVLGREGAFCTQYIPALARENPHIGDAYVLELEQKPEALRRALLLGDWSAFEGQVFTEFRDDPARYHDGRFTHVIKPFPIPGHWLRYVSFDHGYTAPFSVGWWAVAPDGRAYRYREWYGWNGTPNRGIELSPGEIARGILEREAEERREGIRFDRVADPAIFERSRGDSVAQQMGAQGVQFRRGDHARMAMYAYESERARQQTQYEQWLAEFNESVRRYEASVVKPSGSSGKTSAKAAVSYVAGVSAAAPVGSIASAAAALPTAAKTVSTPKKAMSGKGQQVIW